MKKVVTILAVFLLSIALITGCSKESTKTEEEIRAEIEAEMAAEAEAEGGEENGDGEEAAGSNENSEQEADGPDAGEETAGNDSDTPNNQTSEEEELLTFDAVYNGNNLLEVFEYFDENFDRFSVDEKEAYANDAYEEYLTKYDYEKLNYLVMDNNYPMGQIFAMGSDEFYTYYSMADSAINVNAIDYEAAEVVEAIQADDLLTLAASYWATDGYVDGYTEFIATVKPEYLDLFIRIYEIADEYPMDTYMTWDLSDGDFNGMSIAGYPVVYIDTPDSFELFENENVWKTDVILPINHVVYEELEDGVLYIADISTGDVIDCHEVTDVYSGNTFGISLDGEFYISGMVLYDDFYGGLAFEAYENELLPTRIRIMDLGLLSIPDYCYIDNSEELEMALGDAAPQLPGDTVYVTIVIDDYTFSGARGSEAAASATYVSLIEVEDPNYTGMDGFSLDDIYVNETINGTFVDFAQYSTVVVPMYYGDNNCMVDYDWANLEADGGWMGNFTVFGVMKDVVITYNESMDSADVVIEVGEVTNTDFNIYGMYLGDMSNILVTGNVLTGDGTYEAVEFRLNDMQDSDSYEIFLVE